MGGLRHSFPARVAALAPLVLMAVLIGCGSDGDLITFVSEVDGDAEIYVIDPDTGIATPLTDNHSEDTNPVWSPDGKRVAYVSDESGDLEINVVDGKGKQIERLTNTPGDDEAPVWSPDGSRILFDTNRASPGLPEIWVMDADGSNVRVVGSGPGTGHHAPAWSPDGTRLAVQVTMEDGEYVYLATPAGGWGRVKAGTFPAWAPNGDDIYLTRNDSLLVTRASTGSIRLVLADGFAPRPSPDGRWLAFVRGEWPISALYVLDLETGVERRLTR